MGLGWDSMYMKEDRHKDLPMPHNWIIITFQKLRSHTVKDTGKIGHDQEGENKSMARRARESIIKNLPCMRSIVNERVTEPYELTHKVTQIKNELSEKRRQYQEKLIAYKDRSKDCRSCHGLIIGLQSDYKEIRRIEKKVDEEEKIINRQLGEDLLIISPEDYRRATNRTENKGNA